ncbi:glycoside hydrolase [Dentipellis sp. KUC8613]|nr:glycoside hydrolase [Dentipellis sp. KUC8613]
MPASIPQDNTQWWCAMEDEYAFLGFSYEITACQKKNQLDKEFHDIRNNFHSRYVRLYGFCDQDGFYDDIIQAAWDNSLGVYALIWFGFDGSNEWKKRRTTLFATLHTNPKAKFVIRGVQFGSDPLFDSVLSAKDLAKQVRAARANLSTLNIPVTVSEMAYGYQKTPGFQEVLDSMDFINVHMLPFFSQDASNASDAWPIIRRDMNWFAAHGNGKKMILDENGWPSTTSPGVQPNNPNAVADVRNEEDYYILLNDHCTDFKGAAGGGIGWFAHIYSDNQEPGYGIFDSYHHLKFPFKPRTFC